MNHDIFRTPHLVEPTLVELATPEQYAREGLGQTMPMWRVQTEGYTEGTDQLVGIVSRNVGFLDSPDTEWISSGVNSKNSQAVAIGRHGNFLLWGFAASPTWMTDEAKLVFVNALHYIRRFDHQAPIARKQQGTAPREHVRSALHGITDEGYAETVATYERIRREIAERQDEIRARIAAGETVSDSDRSMLDRPPIETPARFAGVRRYFGEEAWAKVADDEQAITAALTADLPFMRSQGWYELVVDEELRQFGVANNDIALLDKAVAALAGGTDADLARKLLERYTNERFATADEWAAWLAGNRERLFFTESGGYKWLVDTTGDVMRGTAQPAGSRRSEPRAPAPPALPEPTSNRPLAAAMTIEPLSNGRHALVVQFEILDGWHAYDKLPPGAAYTELRLELQLPDGLRQHGEWQRPKGHVYVPQPSLTVFEGRFAFRCELAGKLPEDLAQIVCALSYQVCDEHMCLPPTNEELTVGGH